MSTQTTTAVSTLVEGKDNTDGIQSKESFSTNETNEVDTDEGCNDCNDDWAQLMGKDLTMKIVSERKTGLREEVVTADVGPTTNSDDACGKDLAELGDAVQIYLEGYCCTPNTDGDSDTYATLLSQLEESMESERDETSKPDPAINGSTIPTPSLPDPFLTAQRWVVVLGDGDVIPGLEMAIRYLPLGASALVRCHSKYAYGSSGRRFGGGDDGTEYAVPPDTETIYRLTIHSILPVKELATNKPFQIACAIQKKLIGNDCYKHEWEKLPDAGGQGKHKALKAYNGGKDLMIGLIQGIDRDGLQCVDNGEVPDCDDSPSNCVSQSVLTEIRKEAVEVLVDCLNNTAAVHLRAKSYSKAKDAAAQAIQYDRNNIKALCRAAKAAMLDPAASFKESEMAITCAEEVEKENRDVKALRAQLERTRREYRRREKAMYARMIQNSDSSNIGQEDATSKSNWVLYVSFYIIFLLSLVFWVLMKDEQPMHATNTDYEL